MQLSRIVAVCFLIAFLAAGFGLDAAVCQAQNMQDAPIKYEIKSVISVKDAAGKVATLAAPAVIVQDGTPAFVEVKVGEDTYRLDTVVKRVNGVIVARTTLRYTQKGAAGTFPTVEQVIGEKAKVSGNGIDLNISAMAAKG